VLSCTKVANNGIFHVVSAQRGGQQWANLPISAYRKNDAKG